MFHSNKLIVTTIRFASAALRILLSKHVLLEAIIAEDMAATIVRLAKLYLLILTGQLGG
jgi:hypothetical protein